MLGNDLNNRIRQASHRIERERRTLQVAAWWLIAALIGAGIFALRAAGMWNVTAPIALLTLAAVFIFCTVLGRRVSTADELETARRLEEKFPELNQELLAAIAQEPDPETGQLRYLQRNVVGNALAHSHMQNWASVISGPRFFGARLMNLAALAACALAAIFVFRQPNPSAASVSPFVSANADETDDDFRLSVVPGDTELEKGTSLLVTANFGGRVPADATLAFEDRDGLKQQFTMTRSLEDAVFAARVPTVEADALYRIVYDSRKSQSYQVTTFELPQLQRADAVIISPAYTSLDERTIKDTRSVTVVEGSSVRLLCYLNKQVKSAVLKPDGDDDPAAEIELTRAEFDTKADSDAEADTASDFLYEVELTPQKKQKFTLHLVDDRDRENRFPPEFSIRLLKNRRPELKLAFPGRDVRVSPLEELALEAEMNDDFGVSEYGLVFGRAGEEPSTVVLGEDASGRSKHKIDHLIAFEDMQASPDELVSYYFFAEDVGPDGAPRRTYSDMFFAEVRHFEEIFRQGQQQQQQQQSQQQQQQQQQQAQQVEKLAELQKQIINATWTLIRQDPNANSKQYRSDITTVAESQDAVKQQAIELTEELESEEAKIQMGLVQTWIDQASNALKLSAVGDRDLSEALPLEQAVYQGLLKLRATEFDVQQGQPGGGSGQRSGGRSQQQLNQLELDNKQNRYESQREANQQQQQPTVDREQLQILNRLRELARRQEAINEKLKELESELRQARTQEERDEIERRLKRLREEQQQMLRDVDELRDRMDQPENQMQTAEQRQKVEETRNRMLNASEALEQGQVSQALAEGTRAERELEEMKEDFRKQTSNQFADAMRSMRDEARDIAERQQQLSDEINKKNEEKSLRATRDRDALQEGFEEQQERVENLNESMKDVIEQSEISEPLLANQLYDTIRETREFEVGRNLGLASDLMRRGFTPQASEVEQQARQGIEQLRDGIEKAAEGVLGNEVEALKRARRELDILQQELANELAQFDPQAPQQNGQQQNGQPGQQSGQQGNPNQQGQQGNQRQGSQQGQAQGQRPGEQDPQGQLGQRSGQQQNREGQGQQQPPEQQGQNGQQGQQGQQQGSGQRGERQDQQRNDQQGQQQQNGQQQGQQQGGEQPRQQQGEGQQGGQGQGQRPGQQQDGQQGGQEGQQQQNGQPASGGGNRNGTDRNQAARNRLARSLQDGGFDRTGSRDQGGPLTGGDFRGWSDRLREVEEMVGDPELRAEAARIRDRARSARSEYKRHSKEPNWNLVRTSIFGPLIELQNQVADEIAKRESKKSLVPIDRDPVPERFEELVRQYYEELGRAGSRQ